MLRGMVLVAGRSCHDCTSPAQIERGHGMHRRWRSVLLPSTRSVFRPDIQALDIGLGVAAVVVLVDKDTHLQYMYNTIKTQSKALLAA